MNGGPGTNWRLESWTVSPPWKLYFAAMVGRFD